MTIPPTNVTPASWHPDTEDPSQLRWWDGTQWTEQRKPATPAPDFVTPLPKPGFFDFSMPFSRKSRQAPVEIRASRNALILGIISLFAVFLQLLVLFGPIAIVWGIVGLRRSRVTHVGRANSIWGIVLGSTSIILIIASHALIAALPTATSPAISPQATTEAAPEPEFEPAGVEKLILDDSQDYELGWETVACEGTLPTAIGSEFECVATGPSDATAPVYVRVTTADGVIEWSDVPF
jgi:hypothetical protein